MKASVKQDAKNAYYYVIAGSVRRLTLAAIRKSWFAIGKDLKQTANHNILYTPKNGRLYTYRTKSGRKKRHRASAPFETHANLTGALRRSIGWKVQGTQLAFGYGLTREKVNYDVWLEYGTENSDGTWRIAPRPTLNIALKQNERNIENHLERFATKIYDR